MNRVRNTTSDAVFHCEMLRHDFPQRPIRHLNIKSIVSFPLFFFFFYNYDLILSNTMLETFFSPMTQTNLCRFQSRQN